MAVKENIFRIIVLVIAGGLIVTMLYIAFVDPATLNPATVTKSYIDCAHSRPQIRVKSSNDNNFYDVDLCAVADSASGEDFRVLVKK
jgi:hypothetical protein